MTQADDASKLRTELPWWGNPMMLGWGYAEAQPSSIHYLVSNKGKAEIFPSPCEALYGENASTNISVIKATK